jgi:hypothetical protein
MKNKIYRIPYGLELWVSNEMFLYNKKDYLNPKVVKKHASISLYSDQLILPLIRGTYKDFKLASREVEIAKSI